MFKTVSEHKIQRLYKEDAPENTIERITQIMKSMDISIHEELFNEIDGFLFSCRYNLDDVSVLGQNGKGITRDLAIAGALAELMERLQNLLLFTANVIDKAEILHIIPDMVKAEGLDDILNLNPGTCRPDIEKLLDEVVISQSRPIYVDEFYDVKNDKVVLLPHPDMNIASGTNGMCSGNTPAEAIVQGICEILERTAVKEILTGNVLPPTIPLEYIHNTTCSKIIDALNKRDISIVVKDCSLGKGYPVVGVMATNGVTGKYKCSFGSHPIFDYALQRTITELYQGFGSGDISKLGHALILGTDLYSNSASDLDAIKIDNFKRQVTYGKGELPEKIFYSDPTYEFKPWTAFDASESYVEDLKILKELIISNGSNIYIKDVSFLGFPAYYVYITGYSCIWGHNQVRNELYNIGATMDLPKIYGNLARCSEEDIKNLARYIELYISCPDIADAEKPAKWLRWIIKANVPDDYVVSPEHLLALLYLKLGKYEESYRKMDIFFKTYNLKREDKEHLFAFRDALFLLSKGYEIEDTEKILCNYYRKTSVSTVMTMLSVPNINLIGIKVPKPEDYIYYEECNAIFEKTRKKIVSSSINQHKLRDCFY